MGEPQVLRHRDERVAVRPRRRRGPRGAEALSRVPEEGGGGVQRFSGGGVRGEGLWARRVWRARGHADEDGQLSVFAWMLADACRVAGRDLGGSGSGGCGG